MAGSENPDPNRQTRQLTSLYTGIVLVQVLFVVLGVLAFQAGLHLYGTVIVVGGVFLPLLWPRLRRRVRALKSPSGTS